MVSGPIAGVVLAAGASHRFGSLKQNHRMGGQTMLERTVDLLGAVGCAPIFVVTGSDAAALETGWQSDGVRLVHNALWRAGMGGSIACGVDAALESTDRMVGVLIAVCDQPKLDRTVLRRLIERYRAGPESAAACEYGGCRGVPAVFGEPWFDRLRRLRGIEGARKLLRGSPPVATICWPDGAMDIDRPSDIASPE